MITSIEECQKEKCEKPVAGPRTMRATTIRTGDISANPDRPKRYRRAQNDGEDVDQE